MLTRFLTLALLLAALAFPSFAQTASPSWLAAVGLTSSNDSDITSLVTDAAGNVYVSGTFYDDVTLGPGTAYTMQGSGDSFVAKYAPGGQLLWARHLAGSAYTAAVGLALDASGNVYVGGHFNNQMRLGSLSLTATRTSNTQLWLARLDAQGQPQWLRTLGSGDGFFASHLGLDAAGNVYFTGEFTQQLTIGTQALSVTSISGQPEEAVFLAKFDAQGAALWAKQGGQRPRGGTTTNYYAPRLTVNPAGGCYLLWPFTPGTTGFGTLALPAGRGDNDLAIIKFNAQGAPQWLQSGGGADEDGVANAALDGNGQLLVTGFYSGTASFGNSQYQTPDRAGILLALNVNTGAINWLFELTTTSATALSGVATDAAGNIYASGMTFYDATINGQTYTTSAWGISDLLVISFTSQGAVRWVQRTVGTGAEIGTLLAPMPNGGLAVAGILAGTGLFDNLTLTSGLGGNSFLAYLGARPTATRTALPAQPLALYPNPATTGTRLTLPALPAGTHLTLTDALGRVVRTLPATPALSLTGLAPGYYQVQALAPNGQQWHTRLAVE